MSLAIIAGGCSGNGCSCVAPLPNGFPSEERHPNAIQARVTDTGVAFLESNAGAVIEGVVGGSLNFEVPPTCGGDMEVCCGSPPGVCVIEIDLATYDGDPPRLELSPRDPPGNQLGVLVRARVRTQNPLPIAYDAGWLGTIECDVEVDTEWAGSDSITINTAVDFTQDPSVGTTRIAVGAVDLTDLDDGDISIDGGIDCAIADLFKSFFIGQIESQLESQVQSAIGDQVCKSCNEDPNCAPFATCDGDGVCQIDEGGANQRCLQELGMSGRLFAADLLASFSPGQQGAMDIYDVAGGYSRTNNDGLSLGVLGGAVPADGVRSSCVGEDSPPTPVDIPESTFFQVNTRNDTGAQFDVGIGLHEYYLNTGAFAAYEGGFLCLNVGTRSIALLSASTLSLVVPSVLDFLHGEDGAVILGLRPQRRPNLTLGLGTFTTNPNGEKEIDDPLITVFLPELEIDFYAVVDNRYVRIFTLKTDVTIPIGLDVVDGEIVPIMGDLDNAFTNISVTNSELLVEDPAEIADRFPAILSIAVPFIGQALGGFALPEFAGVQIVVEPGGITSVEDKTFLAIFGNLQVAGAKRAVPVETRAEILDVEVPATEVFKAVPWDRAKRPAVTLALGGVASDGTDRGLEWQVRVDGGIWSPYTTSPTLRLSREGFWLQGRHVVEVRAREIGRPDTLDREPVVLEVLVDTLAPQVDLTAGEDGTVVVDARDLVSPRELLTGAWRVGDGAWQSLPALPATLAVDEDRLRELEVRVDDESGNSALADGQVVFFHGRAPASDGCSCKVGASSSSSGAGGWLGALAIVGLLVAPAVRRVRGRGRAAGLGIAGLGVLLAAALAACGGSGGGDGDPDGGGPNPNEVQHGPIGRWSDLAAEGGRVVISAYEESFGDLVIAETGEAGGLRYTVVDGAPDGPVVLDPDGYRGGVNEPGENVGAWTSIALHQGQARISYQDLDRGALKFAAEDGSGGWSVHVVDPGGGAQAGLFSSLSLDSSGVPGIAYMVTAIDDGSGALRAQLRWAKASSASPSSETDWSITTIAEVGVSCQNLCGPDRFCMEATNTCAVDEGTCGDCGSEAACVGGACEPILVDVPVDLPEGTGLFASAARLPDQSPVIAYYDRSVGDLMIATESGGGWNASGVDAETATDTGQWASLAVDSSGVVHIAYQDALGDRLLYRTWNAGALGTIEVVDDGVRDPDRNHPVGASAALVIDASGDIAIAYQDQATSDLLVAAPNGDGTWTHDTLLADTDGVGFFTSADADGAQVWLSTYVYNRDAFPPGELQVLTLP